MRYLVVHPLPVGMTREDVINIQKSAQTDKDIRGYRSFLNLSEGKGFCVFDAPSKERLSEWLRKQDLAFDYITEVELEGEYGRIVETPVTVGTTTGL